MTLNLLKKEIKLNYNVSTIIWIVCAFFMFLIPNYPLYMGPFYITLGIMMVFTLGLSTNDILYSVLLPVRKRDTVRARFIYCFCLELLAIFFGIFGLFFRTVMHYEQNKAGIDINVAYFGFQFILFAASNCVFLGNVYKNPVKSGSKFLLSAIPYFGLYAIFELPVWNYYGMIEGLKKGGYDLSWALEDALSKRSWYSLESIGSYLVARDTAGQIKQLPILAVGIILFIGLFLLSYKRAVKQFEKYNI